MRPRLRGHARLIRYADDLVIGFTTKEDAERVRAVLWKRMAAFGLTLHPDKTRILPFARPTRTDTRAGASAPGTFDFLGFTLYWRVSRKGNWVPAMKTRGEPPQDPAQGRRVVPAPPASLACGAARRALQEAVWALPILRCQRQRQMPWQGLAPRQTPLVQVAAAPGSVEAHTLEAVQRLSGAVPASRTSDLQTDLGRDSSMRLLRRRSRMVAISMYGSERGPG